MSAKLYDSELKVMEIIWQKKEVSAKELAADLAAQVGWSKTTTYTVIKKCIDKGAIKRRDPGFMCKAVITQRDAREQQTDELIDKLYGGQADALMASLLERQRVSATELDRLRELVTALDKRRK